MNKGKRYDADRELNIKKVVAVIIAFAVIVMFIVGLIKGMEKYLEPKVKENKGNQKKRYDEIRIENSEGTKLKLKSNNKNYYLEKKL